MNKKHFCYIPFDGITIDPRGHAQLCPVWSDETDHSLHDFTQSTTTIENIFYGERIKEIREKMLNDEHINACKYCYSREQHNLESKRIKYAMSRKRLPEDITPKIKYLDISFSNQCNLGCVMCNSIHSSHWHQQEKSMPEKALNALKTHYDYNQFKPVVLQKEVLESILDNINDLELLIIKGGEPLYDKNCLTFLDKISNVKPTLKIRMVSNITTITKKTLETFSRLKDIEIFASIDGIGKTYEWIRGTNFNNIDKNFQLLLNHPSISVLGINFVLSIYNVGNMIDTINHFSKYQNNIFSQNNISIYPAIQPYLCANLLLNQHQNTIFKTIIDDIQKSAFIIPSIELQSIKNIIFNIDSAFLVINKDDDSYNRYESFIEFTNWMNTVRKFNIQDEHNYIADIINTYTEENND